MMQKLSVLVEEKIIKLSGFNIDEKMGAGEWEIEVTEKFEKLYEIMDHKPYLEVLA